MNAARRRVTGGRRSPARSRLRIVHRLRSDGGTMTILTTGVLAVILLVIAVGVAITGVHLERNALQSAADGAALAASQSIDEESLYTPGDDPVTDESAARRAAEEFLAQYPLDTQRTGDIRITDANVDRDGTVRIQLAAATDPPLAGWFTRGADLSIPLQATGEARAR